MLHVTGTAKVTKSFRKTTANGFKITDLVLVFDTGVCLDKAQKLYRRDEVKAFILGDHDNIPSANSDKLGTTITVIDSELRVNTWTDKETGKPRSAPELLLKEWKLNYE